MIIIFIIFYSLRNNHENKVRYKKNVNYNQHSALPIQLKTWLFFLNKLLIHYHNYCTILIKAVMACRNFSITLIQVESNKQCKVSVDKNFCMLHFHFNILYISLLLCFIVSFHLTTFDYHSIVCTEFFISSYFLCWLCEKSFTALQLCDTVFTQ